ncbi:MAG: iron-containing redox enzyme family protein [Caulobacter sp.]|nr:iron-containing redox enzyme family protein [Caulobacter sp.]
MVESATNPPPAVFDAWIDPLPDDADDALAIHVKHQTLLRAYQARYVVLPSETPTGSILDHFARHYDEDRLQRLGALKPGLEAELIAPLQAAARAASGDGDVLAYVERLLPELRAAAGDAFLEALVEAPQREHHYRNFLLQSSADLLAEASASALGIIGEFGPPQSALFRILIDEFGFGSHDRKHSVLYRATMRSFGLVDEYNHYSRLFDTNTLVLHNAIHGLFQNPRNLFQQVGFLLFAETAYQRSTLFHQRHLNRFHPQADARYFAEHAHIDLHHTRMVVEEVVTPLVARFGPEIGREIITGAELTRAVFARAGAGQLALVAAFDAAPSAAFGLGDHGGPAVTPGARVADAAARVQIGAIGSVSAGDFAHFPAGAFGRVAA